MIHSARHIVTPLANIVFCCFVFLDLKSGDGRKTCAKTMIPTFSDFGLAEWINTALTFLLSYHSKYAKKTPFWKTTIPVKKVTWRCTNKKWSDSFSIGFASCQILDTMRHCGETKLKNFFLALFNKGLRRRHQKPNGYISWKFLSTRFLFFHGSYMVLSRFLLYEIS